MSIHGLQSLGWLCFQPSFVATVHKSCWCVCALLYFSQQVWEFFIIGRVFKFTSGVCNLWEVCVSDVLVQWAGGQKVQLCFYHILCAVGAQPVFPWKWGLSVAAFLYCKAVFAESVPSQGFPKFWVLYRAQIFCQCKFSFQCQIALHFALVLGCLFPVCQVGL